MKYQLLNYSCHADFMTYRAQCEYVSATNASQEGRVELILQMSVENVL